MAGLDITPEFTWLAIGAGPEPFFLLLAALVLDAVLGVILRRQGRPFDRVAAQLVGEVVRRLGRPDRSAATHLIRGLLLGLFPQLQVRDTHLVYQQNKQQEFQTFQQTSLIVTLFCNPQD